MYKFVTCVPEDIGDEFKRFCADRGETPYTVLSSLVHKLVGKPRVVRPVPAALARRNQQFKVEARLQQLKAADTRPRCPICRSPGDREDASTCLGRGRCNTTGRYLED